MNISKSIDSNFETESTSTKTRLNKALAKVTGLSRRQIDEQIAKGNVMVNGSVAVLGLTIDIDKDIVQYQGSNGELKTLENMNSGSRVFLIYKPVYTVTTRFDPQERKTIYDFIPHELAPLKSAGRLDYMSEGLLVLSNDGELINQLTHPSHGSDKIYLVGLVRKLESRFINMASSGDLEIDEYKLNPVDIKPIRDLGVDSKYGYLKLTPEFSWYTFELSEGRNNQIRRMCEVFGNTTKRLIRVKHGDYVMSEELFGRKYLEVK